MLRTKIAVEAQGPVVQGVVLQVLAQVIVQAVQDLLMERAAAVVALAQAVAVPWMAVLAVLAVLAETTITTITTMTHHHPQSLAMAHATMMANLRRIDIAAVRK